MSPRAAEHDHDIATLYRRYVTLVRRRCASLLGDGAAAEDLAQEVFVTYFDHHRRGERPDNPAAWLYRTATNRALNALRDGRRRRALLDHERRAAAASPTHDERLDVHRVLAEVPEELAAVAVYYYVDGMDQQEIGELLDLHRRTVSRRLDDFRAAAHARLARSTP
ncbi:MAG: sigma-70 family RNA polymerase sigma factor [Deltaproteobacteria bacterium]|nr:MAG: sigma-70 family RNA polymerase sigma factor [Deltaproteobacteria bacterium]